MMQDVGGQDAVWIVLALTVWLALVAGAVGIGVHLIRQRRPVPQQLPSPLDILERQYAAGELDRDEFDQARARLREHEIDL
ncbi:MULTISPECIES: SHOCT domain-containing protein [unclassified Kribbella]|uniref:SHOCT domain-containing protein n=1 Tax=unclassified Kribbella TaxID=2644121 RepID=UPI003018444F